MLNFREEIELTAAREMALLWLACTSAAIGMAALLGLAWTADWLPNEAAVLLVAFELLCGALSGRQFARCRRRLNQLLELR